MEVEKGMNKYKKHILSLAKKYRIKLVFDCKRADQCYASSYKKREVHLLPIKSKYSYVIALHEIGHIITQPRNWINENAYKIIWHHDNKVTKFQLKTERNAWLKARKLTEWWDARMSIISFNQMSSYLSEWELNWKRELTPRELLYYFMPIR